MIGMGPLPPAARVRTRAAFLGVRGYPVAYLVAGLTGVVVASAAGASLALLSGRCQLLTSNGET